MELEKEQKLQSELTAVFVVNQRWWSLMVESIEEKTCGICGQIFRFSQHRKAHQKAEYERLKKQGVKYYI